MYTRDDDDDDGTSDVAYSFRRRVSRYVSPSGPRPFFEKSKRACTRNTSAACHSRAHKVERKVWYESQVRSGECLFGRSVAGSRDDDVRRVRVQVHYTSCKGAISARPSGSSEFSFLNTPFTNLIVRGRRQKHKPFVVPNTVVSRRYPYTTAGRVTYRFHRHRYNTTDLIYANVTVKVLRITM